MTLVTPPQIPYRPEVRHGQRAPVREWTYAYGNAVLRGSAEPFGEEVGDWFVLLEGSQRS